MPRFPAEQCRVVAVAIEGDDAFVVIDTASADKPQFHGTAVSRDAGRWVAGGSSNADAGWTRTDVKDDLGVVYLWDTAPLGVTAVHVEWRGLAQDVPVQNGVYLATWWRQYADDEVPTATAFRWGDDWFEMGA